MADSKEMQVVLKAIDLIEHTLRITSNINHYPKKYRHSLVDRMQLKSMDIYESLHEANRKNLRTCRAKRQELQTDAITYCDQLLIYIELSHKLNLITANSMEYWSKQVKDIKHMAIAWRTKEAGK